MTNSKFVSHNDYSGIHLFNESDHPLPLTKESIQATAEKIANEEDATFAMVEVVFVSEDEIVRINKEHLERDYVTDIISFRYDEKADNQAIEGTLYCCAPRIAEQAKEFDTTAETEFMRIVIHGLLHLVGYDDRTDDAKAIMSEKEDYFLEVLNK